MKSIYLLVMAIFLHLTCQSQEFKFTLIDTIPDATKSELYTKAFSWVAIKFKSANDVVQMQDKEAGKIICKGSIEVPGQSNGFGNPLSQDWVSFTLIIDIKEGRYRAVFSDYSHSVGKLIGSAKMSGRSYGSLNGEFKSEGFWDGGSKKHWDKVKNISKTQTEALIEDMRTAMGKAHSEADNDF